MANKTQKNLSVSILSKNNDFFHEIIKLLKFSNYNISVFTNVVKFLEIPLYLAPSCLITTLDFVRYDQFSLINRIQSNGLFIPVIIIAAEDEAVSSAVDAIKAGVADFIHKPISDREFLFRLNNVINT